MRLFAPFGVVGAGGCEGPFREVCNIQSVLIFERNASGIDLLGESHDAQRVLFGLFIVLFFFIIIVVLVAFVHLELLRIGLHGQLLPPHPCLFVLVQRGLEAAFPGHVFAPVRNRDDLLQLSDLEDSVSGVAVVVVRDEVAVMGEQLRPTDSGHDGRDPDQTGESGDRVERDDQNVAEVVHNRMAIIRILGGGFQIRIHRKHVECGVDVPNDILKSESIMREH